MQKKNKKIIITLSIVFSCIIVLCCVFAFAFQIKTINVDFRSRVNQNETNLPSNIQEKVLNDSGIKKGQNILFNNVEKNINKIEKNNPYVKVEQVIRYFPNKIRFYISERIPKFRVRDKVDSSVWYILDEDFKVLDKIVESEINEKLINQGNATYYQKTIEIDPNTLTMQLDVGEFLNNKKQIKNCVNEIAKGIYAKTEDISVVKSLSITNLENGTQRFDLRLKKEDSTYPNDESVLICVFGLKDLKHKTTIGLNCFYEHKDEVNIDKLKDITITVKEGTQNGQKGIFATWPSSK